MAQPVNRKAAWDARNAAVAAATAAYKAACAAAETTYDADLGDDSSDRAVVRAATKKFEDALKKARADYNAVVWPGVFGEG